MEAKRTAPEYERLLETVSKWPAEWKVAFVRDVLSTLAPASREKPPMYGGEPIWKKARGFLKTDRPAPSDDEIENWLHEHKMEKYG